MSAEHLNPKQFGFQPYDHEAAQSAKSVVEGGSFGAQERHLDLSEPLHPTEPQIWPGQVEKYRAHGWATTDENEGRPWVLRHQDRLFVMQGHHRIAAAKQRGEKTILADYEEE